MSNRTRTNHQFQEQLLDIMAQKNHWAWEHFTGPHITRTKLKTHYQQEYGVYVRDFPVFLSRIHGKNPPLAVRKMLAENIFEEDTGALSLGKSHPELFLRMMKGLGFREKDFARSRLLPESVKYRSWLDRMSNAKDWVSGAAVFTIFVEGSIHDRQELQGKNGAKSSQQISRKITNHPLVRYHQVPRPAMDLIRAHQMVEAGHRHDAYSMVKQFVQGKDHEQQILKTLHKTLKLWLHYRDGVARACGLKKPRT